MPPPVSCIGTFEEIILREKGQMNGIRGNRVSRWNLPVELIPYQYHKIRELIKNCRELIFISSLTKSNYFPTNILLF